MDKKKAIALEYNPEEGAPKVIASGTGHVAENIIGKAKEHGVPVHEDADLALTLASLKIGQEIPAELYSVVARILVFVKDLDGRSAHAKKN